MTMTKFHRVCGDNIHLSQDMEAGTIARTDWSRTILFSNKPLTDRNTFFCRVEPSNVGPGFLQIFLGVTNKDPATMDQSELPSWASFLSHSWVVTEEGDVYKDGKKGPRSGVRLDACEATQLGIRWSSDGVVNVYQGVVDKGVMSTGVPGPVWAVIDPYWCDSISVVRQDRYTMSAKPRGYAVIININKVKKCEDRKGSKNDVHQLKALFKDLWFEVKTYKDLNAKVIKDTLQEISRSPELSSHDCLIVVLMSHGGEDYILGTDGKRVNLEDIIHLFSNEDCRELMGKPKLFFIQACNGGGSTDEGVQADSARSQGSMPRDLPLTLPSRSDILVAKASMKGNKSYRHPETGSVFIQSLVDVIQESKKELDIGKMMARVMDAMQKQGIDLKQCPTHKSTLTKDLYFNP